MLLYGITGKRGHGKDTLAKAVVERNPEFKILHFADELKRQCGIIFGLTEEQMHDPIKKEERFEKTIFMDDFLEKMCTLTGLVIAPKSLYANSARTIMQLYGTDYIRSVKDDYWIECVLKQVIEGGKYLIPDTRYPNEVAAIKERGGLIVKIVRSDKNATDEASTHTSETSIDEIQPIAQVMTTEGDFGPINDIADLIAKDKLIEHIQIQFAGKQLALLVDSFNISFGQWEIVHGMNANVIPKYNPTTGRKEWCITDVDITKGPPSNQSVAVASGILQRVAANWNGELSGKDGATKEVTP